MMERPTPHTVDDAEAPAASSRAGGTAASDMPAEVPSPWTHHVSPFSDFQQKPSFDVAAMRRTMPTHPANHPAALAAWLRDSGVEIVSARSLGELGVPSPALALRRLVSTNAVAASLSRGVYTVNAPFPDRVRGDYHLACHLHAHSDSTVSWGPRMVPIEEGWVARACAHQYNVTPGEHVPAFLRKLENPLIIHRWKVKSPFLWYGRTPAWRYETEIVYVAARPRRYPIDEIHDYLWELAHASVAEHLLAELEGQPRSVWMRTCLLLRYGERRDLAELLLSAAPPGKGPYYFLDRGYTVDWYRRHPPHRPPIWHPDLEVMDYTVDFLLDVRTARYANAIPEWAVFSYKSGRPDGHPVPGLERFSDQAVTSR